MSPSLYQQWGTSSYSQTCEADDGETGGSDPLSPVLDTANVVALCLHFEQEFIP